MTAVRDPYTLVQVPQGDAAITVARQPQRVGAGEMILMPRSSGTR